MSAAGTRGNDSHPVHDLDDLTHQRIRLGVLAILSRVKQLEFTRIRDDLGTTDGNLSRHLSALHDAGLVVVTKTTTQGARTWVSMTPDGRAALRKEVAALRTMLDHVDTDEH